MNDCTICGGMMTFIEATYFDVNSAYFQSKSQFDIHINQPDDIASDEFLTACSQVDEWKNRNLIILYIYYELQY